MHLSAVHAGANVLIQVRDDGAGLDREAIRAKAVEGGLVAPGAELTDKELSGLIVLPGFSTARTVTSVSGRGVGMDVVRRGNRGAPRVHRDRKQARAKGRRSLSGCR